MERRILPLHHHHLSILIAIAIISCHLIGNCDARSRPREEEDIEVGLPPPTSVANRAKRLVQTAWHNIRQMVSSADRPNSKGNFELVQLDDG